MSTVAPQAAMRIATVAVYGYDMLVTIPSEIRLYRRQKSWKKLSLPCILFILARYLGLFYVIWVTYVYFSTGWTLDRCEGIYVVGALFRGLVSSVAATVFLWRTWAIWQKDKRILIFLGIVLIPVTFFSYVPGLLHQRAVITSNGGCTGVAGGTGPLYAKWLFALVNLIYDTIIMILSTWRLALNIRSGNSPISSILLADGVGYFAVAVAVQMTNLIFLLNPDSSKQGTFLTFQTAITTILTQKIITALSERTSIIPSSAHESSVRTKDRSHSRSRIASKFSTVAGRPPPMPWSQAQHNTVTGDSGEQSAVELMKIDVQVEKHISVDDTAHGKTVVYLGDSDSTV